MAELQLSGIGVFYNQIPALKNVDLTLKEGQIHGLLGPNGAGKTTLIRLITGIINPAKGSIKNDGRTFRPLETNIVGYLPEERGLNPERTAIENLKYFAALKGIKKNQAQNNIEELIKDFEFEKSKDKKIRSLSKGNAQKVQFMCTLVHNPEILILDEPFNGFDPLNLQVFFKRIRKLKNEGKTILICTHNMEAVGELCDHITFIKNGEIIKTINLEDINETTEIVELTFKGSMIGFVNSLWTGFELVEQHNIKDDLHKVTLKYRYENKLLDLIETIKKEVQIISFQPKKENLSELFIKLTTQENE
jgi:ABC-2 type transport system ATP-binding protein